DQQVFQFIEGGGVELRLGEEVGDAASERAGGAGKALAQARQPGFLRGVGHAAINLRPSWPAMVTGMTPPTGAGRRRLTTVKPSVRPTPSLSTSAVWRRPISPARWRRNTSSALAR